jgi:hypothetical protein
MIILDPKSQIQFFFLFVLADPDLQFCGSELLSQDHGSQLFHPGYKICSLKWSHSLLITYLHISLVKLKSLKSHA